jgi:hypothetical protein
MLSYLMLHPTTNTATKTGDRPARTRLARTLRRLLDARSVRRAAADTGRAPVRLLHDVAMGGTAATAATRVMRTLPAGRTS